MEQQIFSAGTQVSDNRKKMQAAEITLPTVIMQDLMFLTQAIRNLRSVIFVLKNTQTAL